MRTRHDQLGKSLVGKAMQQAGHVETARQVVGEPQEGDIWFEPGPGLENERERLGLLGRIAELGPCLIEPFSTTPSLREVRACVRKQYALDGIRSRDAARDEGQNPEPPFPRLWILSPGRPETVMEKYELRPMPGWPSGCYEGRSADPLHVLVLKELPRSRETLLPRLLGRGYTYADAVRDLKALPQEAWERALAFPILVALRMDLTHDWLEDIDMDSLQELDAIYAEWEQQVLSKGMKEGHKEGLEEGRKTALRQVLSRLLRQRFGALPEAAAARIQNAALPELERWCERVLTAASVEDVLA